MCLFWVSLDNACSDIYFPTSGIKAFRNKGCRALPFLRVQANCWCQQGKMDESHRAAGSTQDAQAAEMVKARQEVFVFSVE